MRRRCQPSSTRMEISAVPSANRCVAPMPTTAHSVSATHQVAASDLIERTSTPHAPWTLVESNDKYHARIKVLSTLTHAIEEALGKK